MQLYHLTVGELCRHGEISQEWIDEAVRAYLVGDYAIPHPLSSDYALNLANAVLGYPFAAALLRHGGMDLLTQREAVRAALLMARPMKRS